MKHGLPSLIAIALLGTSAPAAFAGGAAVTYDLGIGSAYVWRGITFTDGAVFQPALTVSHESGFGFNVWGNMDIDDVNGLSGDFQEVDLTASYGFGGDKLSAEIGYIEYLFPNGVGPSTSEVYFSLGLDTALSPSLAIYYDFDQVDSFYGTLSVEWGRELNGGWKYAVGLLAGFAADDYAIHYGGTEGGLYNGEARLTLTYEQDSWSGGGFVAYTDTLDKKVLPNQAVDFYGGFFVSF